MEGFIWDFSPLALILGVVCRLLFGTLWYSPLLFGKIFMRLTKLTQVDMDSAAMRRAMRWGYTGSLLGAFVSSFIIGGLITTLGIADFAGVLLLVGLVAVGFSLPVSLARHLWEKRPWGLFPIEWGVEALGLLILGLFYIIF